MNAALIGSNQPIDFDVERLRGKLAAETARLEEAGWDAGALIAWLEQGLVERWGPEDPRPEEDLNTDFFPRDELYLADRPITAPVLHPAEAASREAGVEGGRAGE